MAGILAARAEKSLQNFPKPNWKKIFVSSGVCDYAYRHSLAPGRNSVDENAIRVWIDRFFILDLEAALLPLSNLDKSAETKQQAVIASLSILSAPQPHEFESVDNVMSSVRDFSIFFNVADIHFSETFRNHVSYESPGAALFKSMAVCVYSLTDRLEVDLPLFNNPSFRSFLKIYAHKYISEWYLTVSEWCPLDLLPLLPKILASYIAKYESAVSVVDKIFEENILFRNGIFRYDQIFYYSCVKTLVFYKTNTSELNQLDIFLDELQCCVLGKIYYLTLDSMESSKFFYRVESWSSASPAFASPSNLFRRFVACAFFKLLCGFLQNSEIPFYVAKNFADKLVNNEAHCLDILQDAKAIKSGASFEEFRDLKSISIIYKNFQLFWDKQETHVAIQFHSISFWYLMARILNKMETLYSVLTLYCDLYSHEELFIKNNLLSILQNIGELVGGGGSSQVFKSCFQDHLYAIKVVKYSKSCIEREGEILDYNEEYQCSELLRNTSDSKYAPYYDGVILGFFPKTLVAAEFAKEKSLFVSDHNSNLDSTDTHICNFFIYRLAERSLAKLFSLPAPRLYELAGSTYSQRLLFRMIMKHLASSLHRIHTKGIVHADLKPDNILHSLDTKSGAHCISISDFGNSYISDDSRMFYNRSFFRTTLYYRAPEIALGDRYFLPPVDMWAFGCILYELLWTQSEIRWPSFLATDILFRPEVSFKVYSDFFDSDKDRENAELLYRTVSLVGPICPQANWPEVRHLPLFKVLDILQFKILPLLNTTELVFTDDLIRYRKYMESFLSLSMRLKSISADDNISRLIVKCLVLNPNHRITAEKASEYLVRSDNKNIRVVGSV